MKRTIERRKNLCQDLSSFPKHEIHPAISEHTIFGYDLKHKKSHYLNPNRNSFSECHSDEAFNCWKVNDIFKTDYTTAQIDEIYEKSTEFIRNGKVCLCKWVYCDCGLPKSAPEGVKVQYATFDSYEPKSMVIELTYKQWMKQYIVQKIQYIVIDSICKFERFIARFKK
jgi:hypothetical protein